MHEGSVYGPAAGGRVLPSYCGLGMHLVAFVWRSFMLNW